MTSKTPYHKKIHHKIKPKFHQTHFIKKWPKGFPIHKKWISQFFYLLHGVVVHEEKSLLTKEDMFKANLILRKGDFILTGNLHELTSIIIGGAVTHAALYIGHRTFIQATGKGVHFATLHHIFSNHDTFTILRLPKHVKNKNEIIRKAIQFGHKQIGKSYDYFFTESEEKFFCSELVNSCFHHAGYKTGLRSVKPAHSFIEKAEKKIISARKALRPEHMLNGKFEIVFLSHNLKLKEKKLILHEDSHYETLDHFKKHHKKIHKKHKKELDKHYKTKSKRSKKKAKKRKKS